MVASCGGRPVVIERTLDVDRAMLRGHTEKDDKPIQHCKTVLCYVYDDADTEKIKDYILDLEAENKKLKERLNECESQ